MDSDVICSIVLHIWVRVNNKLENYHCLCIEVFNNFAREISLFAYSFFFSLTLLSLCINLMQEQLVGKVKWLAEEVGIGGGKAR